MPQIEEKYLQQLRDRNLFVSDSYPSGHVFPRITAPRSDTGKFIAGTLMILHERIIRERYRSV